MKKISMIMAAAMLCGAATLTSCKKNTSVTDIAPQTTNTMTTPAAKGENTTKTTVINYQLSALQGPQTPENVIRWTDINANIGELFFNGAYVMSDGAIQNVQTSKQVFSPFHLLAPSQVGSVNIPTGKYSYMAFQYSVIPPEPLSMKGDYQGSFVRVAIPDKLNMTGKISGQYIVNPGYTAKLFIDLDKAMAGIDATTLKLAKRNADNSIDISPAVNPDLYKRIYTNLSQTPLIVSFQ